MKAECPQLVCSNCQKNGHIKRYCPEIICKRCGLKGHTVVDCSFPHDVCHNCQGQDHRTKDCTKQLTAGFVGADCGSHCGRCSSLY